jgi:general secretion pathway protein D
LPVLEDIPYLGRLFRSDSRSNEKRNLLVFIHPTIVGDAMMCNVYLNNVIISFIACNWLWIKMVILQNYLKMLMIFIANNLQVLLNQKVQQVPTGGKSYHKTTVLWLSLKYKKTVQLPAKATERSKNTVTTTTTASSQ